MKTIRIKTSLLFVAIITSLAFPGQLSAQSLNEQVTVVAAYEPSIPEVNKINANPAAEETEVKLPKLSYGITPTPLEPGFTPDVIPSVRLTGEPLERLYRNYARIGFGNYTTPYAEFWATSLRNKSYGLGLHIKHLSSSGEIKDYAKSNNSLNLVELQGQKFFENHTLNANLGFRRNVVHHYGFKPALYEIPMNEDDLKQRFNRLSAGAEFASHYKEKDKFNHAAQLNFNSIGDKFDTRESTLNLKLSADKQFELFSITEYQQAGIEGNLSFTQYHDSVKRQGSSLVSFKPYLATRFNEYTFKVGVDLSFVGDSASKAHLFPFAEASLEVIDEALTLYAGINGTIQRRGFDALSDENPFVQSILPLKYTREKFVFYAGARARAGRLINLYASFKAASVENEPFFVNDFSQYPRRRFTVIYDDAGHLAGRFEAEFNQAEKLNIKAFVAFDSWNTQREAEAWHKPTTTIGGSIWYNLGDKIIGKASLQVKAKQTARLLNASDEPYAVTVNGYTDLSLGLDYRYSRLLTAFLKFNNILGSRYYYWYDYPGYRFNMMAGISYSF
ncbi:MAG: hypothetical protein KUL83_06385 [Lentimicrobium sp.]|jgi:hypothetical protein|nr:hypothetical protein [Lentimicrobium sp.]